MKTPTTCTQQLKTKQRHVPSIFMVLERPPLGADVGVNDIDFCPKLLISLRDTEYAEALPDTERSIAAVDNFMVMY